MESGTLGLPPRSHRGGRRSFGAERYCRGQRCVKHAAANWSARHLRAHYPGDGRDEERLEQDRVRNSAAPAQRNDEDDSPPEYDDRGCEGIQLAPPNVVAGSIIDNQAMVATTAPIAETSVPTIFA
jgi:hypothetical protein